MAARYVIVGLRHQECQPIRMRWLGGQPHHLTKVAAARGSDFYDTYWLRTEDLADRWRSVARLLLRAGSIGPVRAWGTGGSRLPLTSHLGYGLRLTWCDCCSVSETLHSHLVDRGGGVSAPREDPATWGSPPNSSARRASLGGSSGRSSGHP